MYILVFLAVLNFIISFLELALNRCLLRDDRLIKSESANKKGDYVVVIHGIFPSCYFMNKVIKTIEEQEYDVVNMSYPSTKYSIETLADQYLAKIIKKNCINKKKKIHFVTHSLGGILLREYLKNNVLGNLGRVVMFAPPNNGSKIVDYLKDNFFYRWIFGPAGQQLGTRTRSYIKLLPQKVNFELGIIAGNKSYSPISYFIINQPNDGVVSVSSTKIIGMKDHIVIPTCHTCILSNKFALKNMIYFLRNGCFIS